MITVLGAGSIGCFVGGMLAAAGAPVTLIGRPAIVTALADGLTVTTMDGTALQAKPIVTAKHDALAAATTILLCVKSADTAEAAEIIKAHASVTASVISLQNGLTNVDILRDVLGADRVTPGMIGFNVIRRDDAEFVQTTEGEVILAPSGRDLANLFNTTPVTARTHSNMVGVQWSKLLMNLNNALNALSGLGLRGQLEDRDWRRVLAACITEGLRVAKAEGVKLEKLGKVHPRMLPILLRLPNFVFLRIAQSMLRISPTARSSMADDYALKRGSEVDWLNGHIVKRARAHGLQVPVNGRVVDSVKLAFTNPDRPPLRSDPAQFLE